MFNRLAARVLAVALAITPVAAFAQGYPLPNNTAAQGHIIAGCTAAPVLTGGTLVGGSCDTAGEFTSSATSGTLVFATAFLTKPTCLVVDATGTPIAVYATTTSQITLTTLTSAHNYFYTCFAKVGG